VGDTTSTGRVGVLCNDPTSTIAGNDLDVDDGEVVITKAEPGDLAGTFRVWSSTDAAAGGFNLGCIYDGCMSPP
jgi:hypothetical protein